MCTLKRGTVKKVSCFMRDYHADSELIGQAASVNSRMIGMSSGKRRRSTYTRTQEKRRRRRKRRVRVLTKSGAKPTGIAIRVVSDY